MTVIAKHGVPFSATPAAATYTFDLGGLRDGVVRTLDVDIATDTDPVILEHDDSAQGGGKAAGVFSLSATADDYDLAADYITVDGWKFYASAEKGQKYDFVVVDGDAAATVANAVAVINQFAGLRLIASAGAGGILNITAKAGGLEYNSAEALGIELATTNATAMTLAGAMSGGTTAWAELARFAAVGPASGSSPVPISSNGIPFNRRLRVRTGASNINSIFAQLDLGFAENLRPVVPD